MTNYCKLSSSSNGGEPLTDAIDSHREDLEVLADTELPCARIAAALLDLDEPSE